MKKRVLSILLALSIVLTLLPPHEAFAAGGDTTLKEPTVTKLTVTYKDGESYKTTSLLPLTANMLQITMPEDGKLTFEAEFDNAEILDRVYVTSSRGRDVKRLQAYYNPNTGTYITDDDEYFDADDPSYVPGEIGVEYTNKAVAVTDSGVIGDIELNTLSSLLQGEGFKLGDLVSEDDSVTANLLLNEADYGLSILYSELESSAGIDSDAVSKFAGFYSKLGEVISRDLEGADGKDYTLFLDYDENEAFLIILKDITGNKYTKFVIQKTDSTLNLDDISNSLSAVNTTATVLYDYYAISKEMNDLREEIENSTSMTVSEREEAIKKVDALEKDKKWFMVGTTCIPMLLGGAALIGTGGASLIFSALIGSITVASDYFWDYRIGMIQGCAPIENVFEDSNDHGAGWTALTKEYLEAHMIEDDFFGGIYFIIDKSGKYYLAEDIDYGPQIIIQNSDTEITEVTLCLHGHLTVENLLVDSGILQIRDCEYREHEDGSVTGGTATGSVVVSNQGKVYINSGIVNPNPGYGSYAIVNRGGEVILNGGTIIGGRDSAIYSQDGGKVTINGGSITASGSYGIYAEGRNEIVINDGSITGGGVGIWINSGIVTINGGAISGTSWMIQNKYDNTSDVITTITGGSHSGEIDNSGGTVLVNGGKIAGTIRNTAGTVTVSGGEISDYDSAIWNLSEDGIVNVNGGVLAGTSDLGSGDAIKNAGGTINISCGKIYGISSNKPINLRISPTSDIELIGGLGNTPTVMRVANYTGAITYYSSPTAVGIVKTIEELIQMDWRQAYVRLVADGVIENIPPVSETYIITFNPNGGTVTPLTMSTDEEGRITELPTPTRTGYTFEGWFTSPDSGEKVTVDTVLTEDTTVYAQWTQNGTPSEPAVFTITFDANGGTVSPLTMATNEEGKLAELPTPIRSGYNFNGWYTAPFGGTRITLDTVFIQNTTVYAQWTYINSNTGNNGPSYPIGGGHGNVGNSNNNESRPTDTPSNVVGDEADNLQPSQNTDTPWTSPFTDMSVNAWYYDAVKFVSEHGLMNGIIGNLFAPDANLSRAQLAQILYNKEGKPAVNSGSAFVDVIVGAWYSDAVIWAAANNIVGGYGNGEFGPDDNITREQLAVMLWRYAGEPISNIDLAFSDASQISDFAQTAIRWAVENGVLNGKGGNILDPKGFATRAEVAQMLKNYLDN